MKKFTLNNEIRANLQAFADRITPPDAKPGAVPGKALTADEMSQKYGITSDRHGNPLKPGQLYLAKDLPAVNHHRRLCKAYESGGWERVEQYLQPYKTPAAIARDIVARAEATSTPAVFEPLPEATDQMERLCWPVPTAAQRLGHAYESGVADVPEDLWKDYRREISGAEWMEPCTRPCLPDGRCPRRCFND